MDPPYLGAPLIISFAMVTCPSATHRLRGWRNTVDLVLFEISISMKPHPSIVHAYTINMKPVIGLFEPTYVDEVSDRIWNYAYTIYIYIYISYVYIYIYIHMCICIYIYTHVLCVQREREGE